MTQKRWRFVGTCTDGDPFELRPGVDVWASPWRSHEVNPPPAPTGNYFTGMAARYEQAAVIDPIYGEEKRFQIWTIDGPAGPVTFAAGEFSNTIWGFYLPDES
jgi:hypothetical protein